MTKIFTIIVTYNAMHKRWIDRCMKSLRESTINTTAVIVDNGSTDGTREYVPKHYPEAVWMPQEKNLGFGQANNVGIRYALKENANYVLLLNQDAALHPEALERMLKISDGKSLLSPLHLNGDGTRIDEMFRYTLRNARNTMNDDLLINRNLNDSYETGEICAACWLMPRKLIEKIGGFNPIFFHYNEDNNYYHRLVYHNVKTIMVPKAWMFHDRKLFGNVNAYNHKLLKRMLMLYACNINESFGMFICRYMKTALKCYTKDLPHRRYIPGMLLVETLRLILSFPSVISSRKKERKTGLTWL